jgi:hypothetical protein
LATPAEWQRVELPGGVAFEVPGDARRGIGTQVDSTAGWFEGPGYRIAYDLGRFGERLDGLTAERRFRALSRVVAGRQAREVSFVPSDEPFALARIVQFGLDSDRTFTLRVSCESAERCALADLVFGSISTTE